MQSGTVFNIQRYSIDDGPGIRTTVFLKGCPLSCLWCSNPESQNPLPEISWRYTSCQKCGVCEKTCPAGAAKLCEDGVRIDRTLCTVCGACVQGCPADALSISGKTMTTEEVMKVALRDKDYYETSGGGVTASGGEILTQAEFVADIFRSCREAGIHTCADTSGYGPREAMEKILEFSDLVYFDLKHMDPREHARMAGKTNDFIMQNLKAVVEKKIPIVIRTPLIPGYNDSTENIEALCETVTGMNAGASIHILPYHKFGIGKYRAIDKQYELETLEPPGVETIDRVKGIIEAKGLKCEISK